MTLLQETVAFLERVADQLDAANRETRIGGWSTHQVMMNERLVNECRRLASELKREAGKAIYRRRE